jgi:hypothetical protein
LFSSASWTIEQVDWVLRTHFNAEDDDYWPTNSPFKSAGGWMIPVAPGRRVTLEDGTEDIPKFPNVILERQTCLLGASPIRRLSISFATGAEPEEGFIRQSVEAVRHSGPLVTDPDLELNTVLQVGALFARWWPVAFDDLASRSWRPDPNVDPSMLCAASAASAASAAQPRPAIFVSDDHSVGYESRSAQYVHRSASRSTRSGVVLRWMWRHKLLSWILFTAGSFLFLSVVPKVLANYLVPVLGLLIATPIALWMLKWFFWHLLLGGGKSSPRDRDNPDGW